MISVIIPTYKRNKLLFKTLKSLQNQTTSDFEIIVVDNAAEEKIREKIAKFKSKIPIKYVVQSLLGWHNAAHKGARLAKTSLLLFTNDDVSFDSNCILNYQNVFSKYSEMVAAGGPIKPIFERRPPKWLKDLIGKGKVFAPFSMMDLSSKLRFSKKGVFFATNMLIRKNEFFALGGFNPENFGDIRLGDGEIGLNRKIWEKGWVIGYIPDALVYHYIPKERMSMDSLVNWMTNVGAVDMYTLFHEKGISQNFIGFIPFVWPIVRINLKYWIGNLFFKSLKAPISIKVKLQLARSLGQINYIKRLMNDKKLQKLVLRKNWLR